MSKEHLEKITEKNNHITSLVEELSGLSLKEKDEMFKRKIQ